MPRSAGQLASNGPRCGIVAVGIDYTAWNRISATAGTARSYPRLPFYYVEAAGAVGRCGWRNALSDQRARSPVWRALALGGTADLPTLFETAARASRLTRARSAGGV